MKKGLYLEENHLGNQLLTLEIWPIAGRNQPFFLYNILKYLGSQNEPIIIVCKCREEPLRKKERKNYQKAAIIQQLQSSTIHHTSSIVIEKF
jgi:hypothetical protein